MTRVAATDHVLLLLRARLERGAGRGQTRKAVEAREQDALARLRSLEAFDGLNDDERRRAMVQGLLTDEFGDGLANDAAFQSIVDDVARIIGEMPEGAALVDRAIAQLRG